MPPPGPTGIVFYGRLIGCMLTCGRLAGFGGCWVVQYDWPNIS
jgi:hypothetical protein